MVWDFPEDLPVIVSDGNKLRLIFQNVIHRSLKFSAPGDVNVAARYSRTTGLLEFTVAAAGRVFLPEMFRRGDHEDFSTRDSGAGKYWGNYLVETCTQLLGGTVVVEGDAEKSTVTIRLPVKEAAARYREAASGVS